MDKSAIIEIAKRYAELVTEYIQPIEIILYGSYAKGNAKEDSDIDIAIIVSKVMNDFLDEEIMLFKLRHQVDNRIEPKLIIESHEISGFLEDIRKTGYRIYPSA